MFALGFVNRYIDFQSNSFIGPIPTELSMLTALETLYLDSNMLVSTIPEALTALSSLSYVSLPSSLRVLWHHHHWARATG